MKTKLREKTDECLTEVMNALSKYGAEHPRAQIEAYRQNSVSIKIRIIDLDFADLDRAERDDAVWKVLDDLPEEVLSHVSILVLLTPSETKKSVANLDFENPIPSKF